MSAAFAHAALAIAAALFVSLWAGALIVGAVWLGLRCLPKLGAATRYAVWLCALAALVVIPVVSAGLVEPASEPATDAFAPSRQSSVSFAPVAQSRTNTSQTARLPAAAASEPAPASPRKSHITISPTLAVAAALIWLLAACARGLLLLLDVRALAAVRRDAWPWSAKHDYPVLLSDRVHIPLAAGFLRPAIILPAALVEELGADAVETIIVHEVAHLRRYDVWTNAVARIAEAFVALNPAAWLVMRWLATEREIACDDWVVARTGAGDAFARTLASLATSARARAPVAAPSAMGSRHSVVVRIERLLDSHPRRLRLSPPAVGGALMLLALIAFTVQSVSPVLAYEQPLRGISGPSPATAAIAANCAVPKRGIRIVSLAGVRFRGMGAPQNVLAGHNVDTPFGTELPDARKVVSEFGAAHAATFDLTVDSTGRPRKVVVLSAPPYPGMTEHIMHTVMVNTYEPALRDCVPVTSTIRTGAYLSGLHANVYSIAVPAYPDGWSAQNPSGCKVPSLQRSGVPAFPDAMRNISLDASYRSSVRVHVDAAGAVTSAAVVTPSGQRAFDDAVLSAARQATYPLTESSGFKQARPSGAPISWNAEHGSATYAACKPLPAEYIWTTTFERTVSLGVVDPGGTGSR